ADALIWAGQLRAFGTRWTRTRGDGTYELADLPAGTIDLTAFRPPSERAEAQLPLQSGGAQQWDPTLAAVDTGSVKGRAVDGRGAPQAGFRVLAIDHGPAGRAAATATAADGTFLLRPLRRGARVQLLAFRPGSPDRGFPDASLEGAPVDGPPVELRAA